MQNFDVLTLVFLGLAIFVLYKLRSVLGQRTGTEKPPGERLDRRMGGPETAGEPSSNVVPMPGMRRDEAPADPAARIAKLVPDGAPAHKGLLEIAKADPEFDAGIFLDGARSAYEWIVLAFAEGNRATLRDLLSPEVYEGFEAAIQDRETRGEKVETQFVSIDKAEYAEALLRARSAQITVKFVSKLITVTRDGTGKVVDGSAEKVVDVTDVWTFARDVSTDDPNWRLIATESA